MVVGRNPQDRDEGFVKVTHADGVQNFPHPSRVVSPLAEAGFRTRQGTPDVFAPLVAGTLDQQRGRGPGRDGETLAVMLGAINRAEHPL